ncbi:MAG: hypothetical protein Q9162_003060 [Coniocarpon cinnabarinum]
MATSLRSLLLTLLLSTLTTAHIVMTYPGWRGDNLATNGTPGVDDYQPDKFPYGMQWMYPCGGMPITTNRTYWPIGGGAVAFQPGWFQGHSSALLYVNLGIGTVPGNYSLVMNPVFQIIGPTNNAYPGRDICLPQVPMPANLTVSEGDNATIQVVEDAKHGAALFSCVDITFTDDMSKVAPVNESNCQNSSEIQFQTVFSTADLVASAPRRVGLERVVPVVMAVVLGSVAWLAL